MIVKGFRKCLMVVGALAAFSSCSDSSDDDSSTVDFSTITSIESLGLDEVFDGDVPDELSGSSASLALTGTASQEQCHIKRMTQNGLEELHRIGNIMCHFENEEKMTMPGLGESRKYQITFEGDPHDQQKGGRAIGKKPAHGAKLTSDKRVVKVHISQDTAGTYRIDMCDDYAKQVIELTSDSFKRTGTIKMHGTDKDGLSQFRNIKFAADLESTKDRIKMQLFEKRTRPSTDSSFGAETVRRFLELDLPQASGSTDPYFVGFSTTGTWKGITEERFGAARMRDGYGEALLGHTSSGSTEFRRARFKSNGEDDSEARTALAIAGTDIPSPLDSESDVAEPTNNACDMTTFDEEITVSDAKLTAGSSCDVAKFTEPTCTDTSKYKAASADSSISVNDRKAPKDKAAPSI